MADQASGKYLRARRARVRLAIAAIMVIACIYVWDECFKYRIFPKRWGVVEQGAIYRSGQLSPSVILDTLKKHKISRVIDLTGGIPADGMEQTAERLAIQKLKIESIKIPLRGNGTGSLASYALAVTEIHKSVEMRRPVLVHCAAGSKRTSGVLVYYLVLVKQHNPNRIVREMRRYGFGPRRSPELIDFLNRNMQEVAKRLVAAGVLESLPEKMPSLPHS